MHKAKEAAGAKARSLESPLRLVAGAEVAHSGCGEGGRDEKEEEGFSWVRYLELKD